MLDESDLATVSLFCWYVNSYGYAVRRWEKPGETVFMHRMLLNAPKGIDVDHRDGNRLNNQRGNLRLATRSQNNMNQSSSRGGSSKYKGVYWDEKRGKWQAYISIKGKRKHLGRFADEDQAALAYNAMATEIFGEYARLNEVGHN